MTPGPLAPARELYGVMLLERGMAKEALAAFEATQGQGAEPLQRLRRRGRGRRQALGDKAKAKDNYGSWWDWRR